MRDARKTNAAKGETATFLPVALSPRLTAVSMPAYALIGY